MQKKYYALSAIGDIKNVIKENASMRALAIAFYETNDIEQAYKYIQQSMEDAIFSNARLRTMEVSCKCFRLLRNRINSVGSAEKAVCIISFSVLDFFLCF